MTGAFFLNKNNDENKFEKKWFNLFKTFAEQNDDDAGIAGWSKTGLETRIRYFIRYSKPSISSENTLWVDIGCGAGTYSYLLTKYYKTVIGIDYSHVSIIKAKEKYNSDIMWIVANAKSLPINNNLIDGALCFGVSQALSDVNPVIVDISRILKSDGTLWIDALNKWFIPNLWQQVYRSMRGIPLHLRYDSPFQLISTLKNHGYCNIKIFYLPLLPKSLQWLNFIVESNIFNYLINLIAPFGLLFSHSFIIKANLK